MQHSVVNPWQWQDVFGFVQGHEIQPEGDQTGPRILFCAGQAAVSADGQMLHPGDIRAQTQQAFDNLEAVLQAGGYSLRDVVRLVYYTTEMDALLANWDVIVERVGQNAAKPASTLLGVTALAFGALVEIEATAVR